MAFWGKYLLVANTYSDSISVIDTTSNQVVRTIDLGLPIGVPGEFRPAYGAGPNSIAVDAKNNIAYVALYNANAIAVVDLNASGVESRHGHDPGRLCAGLGCAGHGGQRAARCQRQGHRHHGLRGGTPSDEYGRKFVRKLLRRDTTSTPTRTLAPSASFPCRIAGPWTG